MYDTFKRALHFEVADRNVGHDNGEFDELTISSRALTIYKHTLVYLYLNAFVCIHVRVNACV